MKRDIWHHDGEHEGKRMQPRMCKWAINVIMNVHAKIIVVITIIIMYPYLYSQKWHMLYVRVMLGGAILNNSCSHICITLVLTKNAHVRSIRIPFKRLAYGRELLQANTIYLSDNRQVERREGDLHCNFNRKSLPSQCSSWWTTVWSFSQIPYDCPVEGPGTWYTESWYFVR